MVSGHLEKERKLQIIKAAEKRFVKHGLHKTTLDEIARDLRIAKSTLYHYFTSKENLYFSTLRWQIDQYFTRLEEILNQDLQVKEKINEYLKFKETVFDNYKLMLSLFIHFINETHFDEELQILKDLYSREEEYLKVALNKFIFKKDDFNFTFHTYLVDYSWGTILNKKVTNTFNGSIRTSQDIIDLLIDAAVK